MNLYDIMILTNDIAEDLLNRHLAGEPTVFPELRYVVMAIRYANPSIDAEFEELMREILEIRLESLVEEYRWNMYTGCGDKGTTHLQFSNK